MKDGLPPRTMFEPQSKEVINFAVGQPSTKDFPMKEIRAAVKEFAAVDDDELSMSLEYGYQAGDGSFLHVLASFLQDQQGEELDALSARNLFVTNGATGGMLVLLNHLRFGEVPKCLVDEASYFLALKVFEESGYHVIPVKSSEEGTGPNMLELRHLVAVYRPAFYYTVPTYANPTGVTVPRTLREQVYECCRSGGVKIIADEVYDLLYFESDNRVPSYAAIDAANARDTVFSLGSLTKILAPGLRVGWIRASEALLKPIIDSALAYSGGGMNHYVQGQLRAVISSGDLSTYVDRLRLKYKTQATAMVQALDEHFVPLGCEFQPPSGGYFVWVRLPAGVSCDDLQQACKKMDGTTVLFMPGTKFSLSSGVHSDRIRLSFVRYEEAAIQQGMSLLGSALSSLVGK
eukprot:CAMPEP_0113891248 /NCGR_PEP_ID=MMETSP0780_2-20120614/14645_1 /TAXON_ID=652834 /ORGANISM="Palpitomonas bilix" /LENGTH=403 /DNA_ID=CAMNT_0000880833 /DNA_START=53 /DNA_END=1264 /DNA_ORIENTATION=+ /assembly_acc=CAM_ASM_000599